MHLDTILSLITDRGNNITVSQPAPRPIVGTAGEIYRTQRIEVNSDSPLGNVTYTQESAFSLVSTTSKG